MLCLDFIFGTHQINCILYNTDPDILNLFLAHSRWESFTSKVDAPFEWHVE